MRKLLALLLVSFSGCAALGAELPDLDVQTANGQLRWEESKNEDITSAFTLVAAANPKEAVKILTEMLAGMPKPNAATTWCIEELANLGKQSSPAVSEVLRLCVSDKGYYDSDTLLKLEKIADDKTIIQISIKQIQLKIAEAQGAKGGTNTGTYDSSFHVVLRALASRGNAAKEAIPDIEKLLDIEVFHFQALAALSVFKGSQKEAIGELVQELIKKTQERRWNPLVVLVSDGFYVIGEPAIDELIKLLSNEQSEIRLNCLHALSRIGPRAHKAIPFVAKLLASGTVPPDSPDHLINNLLKSEAISVLYRIGQDWENQNRPFPETKEAIDALVVALGDKDVDVHVAAANALVALHQQLSDNEAAVLLELFSKLSSEKPAVQRHITPTIIRRILQRNQSLKSESKH